MTSTSAIPDYQKALFTAAPARLALLAFPQLQEYRRLVVRAHRNHGFELAQSPVDACLAFSGLSAEWIVGGYDNNLSFSDQVAELLSVILAHPASPCASLARVGNPKWDPLRHIEIMIAVQRTFSITLSEEEIVSVRSFAELCDLVALKKGSSQHDES